VQRSGGLARRDPQVRLEPPSVAAVGVAVGAERRQHAVRVAVAEQVVEAPAVNHPRVGVHEVVGLLEIDHADTLPGKRPGVLKISDVCA
jgi:hypothetical protein